MRPFNRFNKTMSKQRSAQLFLFMLRPHAEKTADSHLAQVGNPAQHVLDSWIRFGADGRSVLREKGEKGMFIFVCIDTRSVLVFIVYYTSKNL